MTVQEATATPPADPKAEGETPNATPGATPDPETPGEEFKSEESKKSVLADLAKERDAKRALEARVAEFEQAQQDAEKAKLSDIERAQAETQEASTAAEAARRELAVYKLANAKGIQDADDIELLMGIESEEQREKFAARIAVTSAGPSNPKPDPSQGAKEGQHQTDAEKVAAAEKAGDSDAAKRIKAQQLGALANKMT